ncbi:hypothetical protein ACVIJ6_003553 [Bradyrhizobium sp. USDA 4369]
MAGIIVVICPTQQAAKHATNWLDGQFVQSAHAGIARRAGRHEKRGWPMHRVVHEKVRRSYEAGAASFWTGFALRDSLAACLHSWTYLRKFADDIRSTAAITN